MHPTSLSVYKEYCTFEFAQFSISYHVSGLRGVRFTNCVSLPTGSGWCGMCVFIPAMDRVTKVQSSLHRLSYIWWSKSQLTEVIWNELFRLTDLWATMYTFQEVRWNLGATLLCFRTSCSIRVLLRCPRYEIFLSSNLRLLLTAFSTTWCSYRCRSVVGR
jgi:hypothetical protein